MRRRRTTSRRRAMYRRAPGRTRPRGRMPGPATPAERRWQRPTMPGRGCSMRPHAAASTAMVAPTRTPRRRARPARMGRSTGGLLDVTVPGVPGDLARRRGDHTSMSSRACIGAAAADSAGPVRPATRASRARRATPGDTRAARPYHRAMDDLRATLGAFDADAPLPAAPTRGTTSRCPRCATVLRGPWPRRSPRSPGCWRASAGGSSRTAPRRRSRRRSAKRPCAANPWSSPAAARPSTPRWARQRSCARAGGRRRPAGRGAGRPSRRWSWRSTRRRAGSSSASATREVRPRPSPRSGGPVGGARTWSPSVPARRRR